MIKFDLHLHSNLSDGASSRAELVQQMIINNVQFISFTDHNIAKKYDADDNRINIINGTELDCTYNKKKIHMLGYGATNNIIIEEQLKKIAKKNDKICREMILALNEKHGEIITPNDMIYFENKLIKKRDIAVLLLNKFNGKDINFIYNNFIGSKSDTYIYQEKLDVRTVLKLLNSANAVSVLAHPMTLYRQCSSPFEFEEIIAVLKSMGLDGMEIINPKNPKQFQDYLLYLGNKYDLIFTAGSDFHGHSYEYSKAIDDIAYLCPLLNKISTITETGGKVFEKCK